MVHRLILVSIMVLGFSLPAGAHVSENECARRFNACANACAALESDANDGCLGRCLVDNGCEIDDDKSAGNGTPRDRLPGDALPRSSLPDDRMPAGQLPDSRM